MELDDFSSPIQNQNTLLTSSRIDTNSPIQQQPRKEGLTAKIRQTINAAGKRIQSARHRKTSAPDLTNLTTDSQELILHAVKIIKNEDSKHIISVLDESRNILRNSLDSFKEEQDEYRRQLEDIVRNKETAMGRRKENAIPLSIFMRQKRDIEGLADLRPNSGMNTTYQAYFEALLTPNQNQQQHPSDKAAVIKYIRRRERRKRAEENRKNHQLTNDIIERQKSDIMENLDGSDMKLEYERQRQNNLLRTKINEKKIQSNTIIKVNEIIDQAHEANLTQQRVEQKQRDKIEARLTEVRNRTPVHMIYVESHDNENIHLTDEQRSTTQNSIQLLNENDVYKSRRSTTPIYGDDDLNETISNIHI